MICIILHYLFGWDYVAWRIGADSGVARVNINPEGKIFYWRYRSTSMADMICKPEDVIWLTCKPDKYFKNTLDQAISPTGTDIEK